MLTDIVVFIILGITKVAYWIVYIIVYPIIVITTIVYSLYIRIAKGRECYKEWHKRTIESLRMGTLKMKTLYSVIRYCYDGSTEVMGIYDNYSDALMVKEDLYEDGVDLKIVERSYK